jgi:arginyl-tRNA--protein-N-Asp/Glu arginylyltransferase
MEIAFQYLAAPSSCGYLPEQTWRLEYEVVTALSRAEYMERMLQGWRRFGDMLFRPRCPGCAACRSLRVVVERFRPNRSQRRNLLANQDAIQVRIGKPAVSRAKLALYDRYHAFQTENKAWPELAPKDAHEYARSFVENPFPTQEWCYFLHDRLVGVGYVDDLPGGLSAIYFFYDPDERQRGLGVFNVLNLIAQARARKIPHVYLGYYVVGCPSMAYKANFTPNQVRSPDGAWIDFRS